MKDQNRKVTIEEEIHPKTKSLFCHCLQAIFLYKNLMVFASAAMKHYTGRVQLVAKSLPWFCSIIIVFFISIYGLLVALQMS